MCSDLHYYCYHTDLINLQQHNIGQHINILKPLCHNTTYDQMETAYHKKHLSVPAIKKVKCMSRQKVVLQEVQHL